MMKEKQFYKSIAIVFFGLLFFNFVAQFWFLRIDFTKEKRYTLSQQTLKILGTLKKEVHITIYLDGDLPAGFKHLRNATKDLLLDLKSYSNGRLHFDLFDPNAEKRQEQKSKLFNDLYQMGVEPLNVSVKTDNGLVQQMIFPSLVVFCEDKAIPVKLLQNRIGANPEEVLNNSIQNLEYALISSIQKATQGGLAKIGVLEGHNELNDWQLYDAIKTLSEAYMVGRVNLDLIDNATLNSLKLLLIVKPQKAFSKTDKYKIDQYIMRGGKVIWALDNVGAELDSLRGASELMAFPRQLNVDDMLFRYGARVNYDLIADMNCGQIPLTAGENAQIQMVPWLFHPLIVPVSKHPLVKNLDAIRTEFVSTIDTLAVGGIKKTILLTSSPFSKHFNAPKMLSLQMVEEEPNLQEFNEPPKPIAVLLEGRFHSLFKMLPIPEGINSSSATQKESVTTQMIVISDGDVFKNQLNPKDNSPFPLGYDRYTSQSYGNKALLLNMIDYMASDAELIVLRNREIKIRLLNKVKVRSEKFFWQTLNLLLPLLLLGIFGLGHYYWRKTRYAK